MTQLRTGLERMCRLFCPEQVAFHARQDLVNFHSHLWARIQVSLRLAQDKQNLRYFSRRQAGIHVFFQASVRGIFVIVIPTFLDVLTKLSVNMLCFSHNHICL